MHVSGAVNVSRGVGDIEVVVWRSVHEFPYLGF